MNKVLLTAALFYVGWLACILLRGPVAVLLVITILTIYLYGEEHRSRAAIVLLVATVFGFAVDNAMLSERIVIPEGSGVLAPIWMTILWPLLATTFNGVFKALHKRLTLSAILAGIVAPFSYLGAVKLGAAEFGVPAPIAMTGIGVVWAMSFPMGLLFTSRLMERAKK